DAVLAAVDQQDGQVEGRDRPTVVRRVRLEVHAHVAERGVVRRARARGGALREAEVDEEVDLLAYRPVEAARERRLVEPRRAAEREHLADQRQGDEPVDPRRAIAEASYDAAHEREPLDTRRMGQRVRDGDGRTE